MWIPGHKDIKENELDNGTAREALFRPLTATATWYEKDLHKYKKQSIEQEIRNVTETSEWYKKINQPKTHGQRKINRETIMKFIRLTLGRTSITHKSR